MWRDEFRVGIRSIPTMSPRAIAFTIHGPIERADLPGLCDRVCAFLSAAHAAVVECDVSSVCADAVTVDALARLELGARRSSCLVRLRGASDELRELVAFMGLAGVLLE